MRLSRTLFAAWISATVFFFCSGCTTETPDDTPAPSVSAGGTRDSDDSQALATASGADSSGTDAAGKSAEGVSGRIKSVGSDTMNNLMTLWLEGFKRKYPNVEFEIEGKGSGTAPTALIAGSATFGPMSRAMKDTEVSDFSAKFGYKPTELSTAIDMLAVYVNKDNPIKGISLKQLDAVFSASRKGGGAKDIKTWGDLGLEGEWADKPISLYGRNSASGTYGFFKERALFGGDFKNTVKENPGSSAVVQGVSADKYGMGYSGMGYKTADVRFVPVSVDDGGELIEVTAENAYSGAYPLARFLYVYLNYKPNEPLDPLRREFVRYIYSPEGKAAVEKDGYLPVGPATASGALESVGIESAE